MAVLPSPPRTWLEGTYTETYPDVTQDRDGMLRLFRRFSFPGGTGSHVTPEMPGSIHEGGELGYALSHAYGAAFDDPELVVFCVVGDGEAETGPLAAGWQSVRFVDPVGDGAVVPILHLNGYKISNPTVLARIPRDELESLFRGHGYEPLLVEGDDPEPMHQRMATVMDQALDAIADIQQRARSGERVTRPRWPMIDPPYPEGLDRTCGGRRPARRGQLPVPPGPARRGAPERGAPRPARGVAALVPPR